MDSIYFQPTNLGVYNYGRPRFWRIYLRNARRALRLNRTTGPVRGGAFVSFAFGLLVALGLPAAAQRGATRAVRSAGAEILAGGELSPRRMRMARAHARDGRDLRRHGRGIQSAAEPGAQGAARKGLRGTEGRRHKQQPPHESAGLKACGVRGL